MSIWLASLWLLLSAVSDTPRWRLIDRDSSVHEVWGAPRLSGTALARLHTAWVWTAARAPRRVAPGEVARMAGAVLPPDSVHMAVRVVHRGGLRPPADLAVIAAPIEMWEEVPEGSLPHWPVPFGGKLEVPIDGAHRWRLRLAGTGEGSWWVDARPGATTATLAGTPAAGFEVAIEDERGRPVQVVGGFVEEGAGQLRHERFRAALRGSGRLAAAGVPDAQEVSLGVIEPGYEPAVVRGWPSALPHLLRLQPGASLSGHVADEAGRPLSGVAVEIETWARAGTSQLMHYRAVSDAAGAWSLAGVPHGEVALSLRRRGFVPWREQLQVAAGRNDLGRRMLAPGSDLKVRVEDAGGPVGGAHVDAGSGIAAVADATGVATLEGVPQAALTLVGSADRHQPASVRANPPFPPNVVLTLPRAFTVTGRFVDASGVPVAGGQARIEMPNCRRQAALDDGGRFTLDLAPGQPVTLALYGSAVRELRTDVAAGRAGEVRDLGDLQPPPGIDLTGRVVATAAAAGAPILVAGAHVWLPRPGPGGPVMAWANGDLLEATSGDDGTFRLSGLQPGAARLRIDAAGYARTQVDVPSPDPAADGSVVDLGDVAVSAGIRVHVLVRPTGRSSDDALESATARVDLGNRWLDPDLLQAEVHGGEAVVPNVPAGPVTVSVVAASKLVCDRAVTVAAGDSDMDVDCSKPTMTVTGTVTLGSVPGGGGTLIWRSVDDEPLPGDTQIDNVGSPAGLRQQQVFGLGRPQVNVPVDHSGRFQTQDLTPGNWSVSWSPRAGSLDGTLTATLPNLDVFALDLPFPGLAVTGTVVTTEGKPVAGARVRELTTGGLTTTADDGSFTLAGLPPAAATLQARLGDRASRPLHLDLAALAADAPPDPVKLVLADDATPRIAVQLATPAGAPIPGAFVFVEQQGAGQSLLTTGPDGRASSAIEGPEPAAVRAAAYANGFWVLGTWTPWDAAQAGIALVLDPAGHGALRVTASGTGPLTLVSADAWNLSWMLQELGAPPTATPAPSTIRGLPSGPYTLSFAGTPQLVEVPTDGSAEARVP